jgi:hypothetical protein
MRFRPVLQGFSPSRRAWALCAVSCGEVQGNEPSRAKQNDKRESPFLPAFRPSWSWRERSQFPGQDMIARPVAACRVLRGKHVCA